MSNFKRGYLNREEENFLMVSKAFIQMINGLRNLDNRITGPVWEEYEKRGMITPSMQKSIKMVNTYLNKFTDELQLNLDQRENKRIEKKLMKFDFKIVDDYTMQRLFRDIKDRQKYITMDRNKFMDILEPVSGVECVGCKKDYKSCQLCKAFEDICIPHIGEKENCPYATDLSEFTPEQKKDYEELVARLKINNKFMKGEKHI